MTEISTTSCPDGHPTVGVGGVGVGGVGVGGVGVGGVGVGAVGVSLQKSGLGVE